MSLSLKAELEIWAAALKAYDEQDFEQALDQFSRIADSSKILTNIGLIYATIGEHETAVEHFVTATNLDPYLAIAHFQCGVSNFLLQRYDPALLNFEDAHRYLRGNEAINYDQLGLKFKLFSAEVMFNKGLTQLNLGYAEQGMADMQEASRIKVTDEHGVIDEAIRDRGEGYTVFSIPVGVLYRPSENKLKNSKSKDYLGKAKLVAASDSNDAFTEFTGVVKRRQASVDDAENKSTPDVDSSALNRSITHPLPRIDPIAPHPTTLERSKTTLQLGAPGIRPNPAGILASRRSQSVSNPTNVPPSPSSSGLSRSNTSQGRSNTTRLARDGMKNAGVMPLRVKTPQEARAGGENGTASLVPRNQSSHRRLKSQGASPTAQESIPSLPYQALHFPLPTVPPSVQEGHLTQFYNTYMDVYTDDRASRSAIPRPPTAQASSNASSSRQPPASPTIYQQPQPQSQEQQQLPAWVHSGPSSVRSSSNASASSGTSRVSSRAANGINVGIGMGMNMEPVVGMNQIMGNGGINNVGGGTVRRKVTRRPMARRMMVYEDKDGDDGFVAGEFEEFEMANIRVKLHYQGDVRGMTMPLRMTFSEFVERVTTKFGTSTTGLGMKFTDEDGTKISLRDEGDFELAIETARGSAKGRSEGKIEVWCVDV